MATCNLPPLSLLATYLFIVQVGLEPVPHHGGREGEPEVHEANPADVRRVAVVEQAENLLLGQLEGVELVEETEGGGGDSSSRDSPHATTHPGRASASCLSGARGPGLEVINFVIDFINNLVKCSHLKQLILKVQWSDLSWTQSNVTTLKYGEP